MNFKRIEWIFLIAFIALDIFLIGAYYNQSGVQTENNSSNTQTATSVLRSLKDDQISYPKKLSNKPNAGFYISSADDDYLLSQSGQLADNQTDYSKTDHKLTVTFDHKIKLNSLKNPQKTINKIIKDKSRILEGDEYRYDPRLSTDNEVVYTQMVYGKRVTSDQGCIRFVVANGYVTGYSQTYLQDIQILREKKATISQKRALIWLYQYNKLPANSKVKWIELGYSKLLSVNGSTVYIPAWSFLINSGNSTLYRKINAFNGAVMD
ncbi:hypothetical protein LFYK43_07510 [Ligilactobacillus salitolerans]|uniref:Regulatory protein YycH-like domain-containing protein n=1 Tax=Ligilactobacillus salitolerans TaxID=1808352 RepID=A0A401IRY2_9LACO|nr:two-component system regulatory protein YycI [Ligilactobacillus salitolerans]GBG94292.1 hypothetical protein LFYK43_07510 [Ligilactobacillus salitolerans]